MEKSKEEEKNKRARPIYMRSSHQRKEKPPKGKKEKIRKAAKRNRKKEINKIKR
jgi:hypothetical protein